MAARSLDLGFGNDPEVTAFERTLLPAIRFKSGSDIGEIVFNGADWDVLLNGSPIGTIPGGGGGATWGSITGTLSDQTDLQSALDASKHYFLRLTGNTGIARQRDWVVVTNDAGNHQLDLPENPVNGDRISVLSGGSRSVDLNAIGDYVVGGMGTYTVSSGPRYAQFVYVEAVTDWLVMLDVPHII